MGRSFAGVLGLTAFAATMFRGALHESSAAATSATAIAAMAAMAAVGFILGSTAESTITHDLRSRWLAETERGAASTDQQPRGERPA